MLKPRTVATVQLACACAFSVSTLANADTPQKIDIPAGELTVALHMLAQQSGAEFVYSEEQVRGLHTPGARGEYTAQRVVTKLLEGTNLAVTVHESGALLIAPPASPRATMQQDKALASEEEQPGAANDEEKAGRSFWSRFRLAQLDTGQAAGNGAVGSARGTHDNSSGQLEEVIVTAQKREQSLLEVPVAISVFSADFLESNRVSTVADLIRYTPGLTGSTFGASANTMVVRGLTGNDFGFGSDATFGVYLNEVFVGRKSSSITDVIDIERLEVVKGPQSTLFGRNSTAGAVSITTRRPGRNFEADLVVKGGSDDYRQVDAAVTIPLGETVSFRGAGRYRSRDGYLDNILDDNTFPDDDETLVGRGTLLWMPNSDLEVQVDLDGSSHRGTTPGWKSSYQLLAGFLPAFGLPADPALAIQMFSPGESLDPYSDIATNLPRSGRWRHVDDVDIAMVSTRVKWDIGDDLTLTSVTGWREDEIDYGTDDDGTPLTLLHTFQKGEGHQFTQELRLNVKWSRVDWFVGASILDDKIDGTASAQFDETLYGIGSRPLVEEYADTRNETFGWAVYGDATWHVTERLNFSSGVRYSSDKKDFRAYIPTDPVNGFNLILSPTADVPIDESKTFASWQPRFALDYQWNDQLMTYATIASGYRPGGFNNYGAQRPFDPEHVRNYEMGAKGKTEDGRLTAELAFFYYTYDDLQVQVPTGAAILVENAGEASGKGVELALTAAPTRNLDLFANVTWMNAEYDTFELAPDDDRSGNKLIQAPSFKGSIGGRYTFPIAETINGFVRADYYYTSRVYFDSSNSPFVSQGAYSLTNASIGIQDPDGRWSFNVFAENLFDKEYLTNAGGLLGDTTARGVPRFIGAEVAVHWK